MAAPVTLTYVDRPVCMKHNLPDLAPTNTQISEAGQAWTCPDCGRVWTTIVQYGTGAQCNTIWQSTAAPGQLSPLGQRVQALETASNATAAANSQQAQAVTSLTSRVTAVEGTMTTLGTRTTALEGRCTVLESRTTAAESAIAVLQARTVVVNYARAPITALLVNGKLDVTVTWDQAFADTTYTIRYPAPSSLLTKATLAVKSKTTTGAVFTVTATAAVVASELEVIAYRYG